MPSSAATAVSSTASARAAPPYPEGTWAARLQAPQPLRPSAAACAPSAVLRRDGGRPLPVAGLGVSRQVILNKAGSTVPLVPPKAASGCRGVCCRGRGLRVLTGLYKIVQVEACDERGGLAVRLIQRPPPAQSAGGAQSVLSLYRCARVELGHLAVHGPSPACTSKPVAEGPASSSSQLRFSSSGCKL